MTTSAGTTPELDAAAYEILRAAVNLARFEQIRSLKSLRSRLTQIFPGETARMEQALRYWARYLEEKQACA